ncbi:hypothetical protein ACWEQ4_00920 [Rhodococcus sp. NPDC003994]
MNRRLTTAAIATATTAAVLLTGCGSNRGGSVQPICVDRITNLRVDDDRCNRGGSNFYPWYLTYGQTAPRIGARPTTGSATIPKGARVETKTAPAAGGKVDVSKPKTSSGSKSNSGGSKSGSVPRVSVPRGGR